MKHWKVALGLGAACVACCAVPIAAGVATLAAASSALIACADELVPAAWGRRGGGLSPGRSGSGGVASLHSAPVAPARPRIPRKVKWVQYRRQECGLLN